MSTIGVQVMLEISSEGGTSRVPVRTSPVRLGRATDNDVVLANEPTVSRHHVELHLVTDAGAGGSGDGVWNVVDLGSRNGTHVNGVRLAEGASVAVAAGDVVGLGSVTMTMTTLAEIEGLTVDDPGGRDLHRLLTALSARERDVLTLVAAGRTDAQVAEELFISKKTVHSHLDRIRDKTGVRRRAELTRLAVRLGLSTHTG